MNLTSFSVDYAELVARDSARNFAAAAALESLLTINAAGTAAAARATRAVNATRESLRDSARESNRLQRAARLQH